MPVQRTYASRGRHGRSFASSSSSSGSVAATNLPASSHTSAILGGPRRPLRDHALNFSDNIPSVIKSRDSKRALGRLKPSAKQKTLTQLHFCIDQTIMRTCRLCDLSYIKGAPDDESLHRAHCSRILKGMEWGKDEEKEAAKANVQEVACGVKLKNGRRGRIICFPSDVGGKIGSKQSVLLQTINLALSSPALAPEVFHCSKTYIFLLENDKTVLHNREKIIGCVVAQRISTAMAITSLAQPQIGEPYSSDEASSDVRLVPIDSGSGLFCHPELLPTPMGVPRLFVSTSHRRQGVASSLLTAAAQTFVHGCPLDPYKGQVAFTQPTGDGNALMQNWGLGGVRIYDE